MSKRYGKKRVPDCKCTHAFTCHACLRAALVERDRLGKSMRSKVDAKSMRSELVAVL